MIVNLTPHAITMRDASGRDHLIPPSGTVARVSNGRGAPVTLPVGTGGWVDFPIPVIGPDLPGAVTGLPDPVDGTYLIVSGAVGAAVAGRRDVLVPGTGPGDNPVRDDEGRIVAVRCLKLV